jgi:16S rRNA (guanine527-N7)-methyltransferase
VFDNYDNLAELVDKLRHLLTLDGLGLGDEQVLQLQRHVDLVREWNRVVGVVSTREVEYLWERHVADSLSLAAVVGRLGFGSGHLMDVGSGGGFPAISVKVVFPQLRLTLVERSEKKVGFLRKAVGALALADVKLLAGEFSQVRADIRPDVVTARAVENPRRLAVQIAKRLAGRSVFFSQSGVTFGKEYSVERVMDGWTAAALRRGTLDLVRRRE